MKKFILSSFLIFFCLSSAGCEWFASKSESTSPNIIAITSEEIFQSNVLENKKPVIVKFETSWCGACKAMAPTYEKLAEKMKTAVVFTTLNADNDKVSKIANEHKIRGVPTFKFFKDGKVIGEIVGGIEPEKFEIKIKEIFGIKK